MSGVSGRLIEICVMNHINFVKIAENGCIRLHARKLNAGVSFRMNQALFRVKNTRVTGNILLQLI